VLELKDKISSDAFGGKSADTSSGAVPAGMAGTPSAAGEALEALMVLGYSQGEAAAVLRKIDPALSTQDLIKEALKIMASRD
jgi:Holliday junction DNA helicase RuvA